MEREAYSMIGKDFVQVQRLDSGEFREIWWHGLCPTFEQQANWQQFQDVTSRPSCSVTTYRNLAEWMDDFAFWSERMFDEEREIKDIIENLLNTHDAMSLMARVAALQQLAADDDCSDQHQ